MKKLLLFILPISFFIIGCGNSKYENICKNTKDGWYCNMAGDEYRREHDLDKAREYFALACEYGYTDGCVDRDKIDSNRQLLSNKETQCKKNGDSGSCISLGIKYEIGLSGVEIDLAKAREYYAIACEYGDKSACKEKDKIIVDEDNDWFLYLIGGMIGVFIVVMKEVGKNDKKKKEGLGRRRLFKRKDEIYDKYDFKETNIIHGDNRLSFISIDENSKQICLLTSPPAKIYNFKDIMKSEIVENGNTTVETSRGSQAVGAVVGGALLGGAGLIVGGLSGKKTQKKTIDKIDLIITVRNTSRPIHVLHVLEEKSESQYEKRFELARKWHSIISIIIKETEEAEATRKTNVQNIANAFQKAKAPKEERDTNEAKNEGNGNLYVADEIRKLKALKDEGILTEEEFTAKKTKLLEG